MRWTRAAWVRTTQSQSARANAPSATVVFIRGALSERRAELPPAERGTCGPVGGPVGPW